MQQRYTIAKGWAILSYILCAIFAGAGIALIALAIFDGEQTVLWLSIGIMLLAFGSTCFLGIYRASIIIGDESITYQGLFTKNELRFIDIKGFRINNQNNNVTLIPYGARQKKMRLGNISYLKNYRELARWIEHSFINLDAVEYNEATDDILQDRRLGVTDTDRFHQLRLAKRVVGGLNAFVPFFLLVSVYAIPLSNWFIVVSLCLPVACFMVIYHFKGIVLFDGNEKGAHPVIGVAVMLSGCGLALKAILNCAIYNYYTLWLVVGFVAIVLFVITYMITKNEPKPSGILARIFISSIFALTFAFGSVTVINCYYDQSAPVIYKAIVLKKTVDSGKVTTYSVTLSAWANKPSGEETNVPRNVYNQLAPKDTALVVLKKGLLGIPWYYVMK